MNSPLSKKMYIYVSVAEMVNEYYLFFRAMHCDRREESMERVLPFQRESPKTMTSAPPNSISGVSEPTLTAASLIDAIITHQINQSPHANEVGGPAGSSTSAKSGVDILFNRYRRNETRSPVDPRAPPPPKDRPNDEAPPPPPPPPATAPPGSSSKAAFTLGEHIESIIAKDFHQGSIAGANDHDWERDWQRRQVDYHRSRMSATANDRSSAAAAAAAMDFAAKCRAAEGAAALDYAQDARQPATISPLDYVKKKIVEVMRTSSDNSAANHDMAPPSSPAGRRGGVSPAPSPNKRTRLSTDPDQDRGGPSPVVSQYPHYPAMNYPFSIPPNVPISTSTTTSNSSTSSAGNQPVVVLSSQYEPLSDED